MIRITPYYKRTNRDAIQRAYLRMVAASTPFIVEDVLYDDELGKKCVRKVPRKRTPKYEKLLEDKKVTDVKDQDGKLIVDAKLAEIIIGEYSDKLHSFLYKDGAITYEDGRVNRENLRKLLFVRLPNGRIPEGYRFDRERVGSKKTLKRLATSLYDNVFRYDVFSRLDSSNDDLSVYEFVRKLDVRVCPYCNRLFTTTVSVGSPKVRPQLDHFRNKSNYPFLALSINNLVPTCGVCNLLKSNKDDDFIYPYDDDFEAGDLVFRTTIPVEHTVPALEGIRISEEDFCIKMERREPDKPDDDKWRGGSRQSAGDEGCREPDQPASVEERKETEQAADTEEHKETEQAADAEKHKETGRSTGEEERWNRIQNSMKALCLDELYQSHRDYVSFLYRQRYILTKELAEDLYHQFSDLFESVEEVEEVFALMHTDYGHWGDRPLSKLTHDILDEIEELYGSAGSPAKGE